VLCSIGFSNRKSINIGVFSLYAECSKGLDNKNNIKNIIKTWNNKTTTLTQTRILRNSTTVTKFNTARLVIEM